MDEWVERWIADKASMVQCSWQTVGGEYTDVYCMFTVKFST